MSELVPKIGIVYATGLEKKLLGVSANEDMALMVTGMRKALARAGVEHLLQSYGSIQDVVNVGLTGSLYKDEFPPGEVVLASSVQAHDGDSEEPIKLEDSLNILGNIDVKTARVLSGDQFITGKTSIEKLARLKASGDVIDMEAFAIAQTCLEHNATPHVLKLVSDTIIEGRSGILQILGLFGALRARKNMDPVFQETLQAIREFRGN